MATRETQIKITTAALALFNEHGSASVSFEKIACKAGISKGNLHYHYASKEEIVMALWAQLDKRLHHWGEIVNNGIPKPVADVLMHQFEVTWEFRFLYSEFSVLLSKDPDLRYRFKKRRAERMGEIKLFCNALMEKNILKKTTSDDEILCLIKSIWVISDYWLSYVFAEGKEVTHDTMTEGYELISQLIRPYLVNPADVKTPFTSTEVTQTYTKMRLAAGGEAAE